MLEGFLNSSHHAVQKVATKSVLSGMLWLVGLSIGPLTYGSLQPGPMQIVFMGLLALLLLVALGAYWYFALNDPNRLQSEEYLLERTRLDYSVLGDNRNKAITLDANAVTGNTHLLQSGDGRDR